MKQAFSVYLRTTDNVGDAKVSPADYFEFPLPVEKLCIHDAFDKPPPGLNESFIIFGGGGLIHSPHPTYADGRFPYLEEFCKFSKTMISWGVGHNVHEGTEITYPDYFVKSFILHGVRDMNQSVLPWVPCVSCMDKAFDRKYIRKRKYSVVGHNLDGYPSLDGLKKYEHRGGEFEPCIKFIGEGEYIITNSFHGAYWGALLGKKVVVFKVGSTKFLSFPESVILAEPKTWKSRLNDAAPDPKQSYLKKCREASVKYHDKVVLYMERYIRNEI